MVDNRDEIRIKNRYYEINILCRDGLWKYQCDNSVWGIGSPYYLADRQRAIDFVKRALQHAVERDSDRHAAQMIDLLDKYSLPRQMRLLDD